ncbi:MAG: hypothetical protein QOG57_4091 [Pseudonocardiales bacterium]|nr:hypothetical protein [Pseudonocardiales bacterium]
MTTDAGTGSSRIQDNIEDTREALRNDVDALSERVAPARAVRGGGRRIADTTRDLRERVMGTAQDAAEWMADAGSTATNALSAAPETARDHTRGHPLAAGLVAFGAGWLLSALLPSTSRERQLGHRATELAADQIGPLTEQAGDVVSSAVANLREPVENAAGTVRTTARHPGACDRHRTTNCVSDRPQSAQEVSPRRPRAEGSARCGAGDSRATPAWC